MRSRVCLPWGLLLVGLIASEARPQSVPVVGPQRRVSPAGQHWRECAVGASLANANEVVVAANLITGAWGVEYAVTLDGGVSFAAERLEFGLDPWVTVDPVTSWIWISALGIKAAWKEPGQDTVSGQCTIASGFDKPAMAIGPNGRHHLLYMGPRGGGCDHPVRAAHSDDPTNPNCPEWPNVRVQPPSQEYQSECRWEGWGALPVVLNDGRIVVVVRDENPASGGKWNNKLPYVVYSDDDGVTWLPDALDPVKVADPEITHITATTIDAQGAGDTPDGIDRRKCAPAIAVDRTVSPNEVYVAFYARKDRDDTNPPDRNTDIYICRSYTDIEGNLSFPTDSLHLLQVTDGMLGIPEEQIGDAGPDQVMPGIAIDACGGINLVFYDNCNNPVPPYDERWDLYYVRITGLASGTPSVYQERLTPESFVLAGDFLGDYHNMAVAGPKPTVYTAYMAVAQDNGGQWTEHNCYLHKIRILCISDLNRSGASDAEDVSLFEAAYSARDRAADLNGDGVVDEQDSTLFRDVYTNGCDGR